MGRKSIRVKKAGTTPPVGVARDLDSVTGAFSVSALAAQIPVDGFTAESGFSISSGPYVDGATVTITRSSGTFGAKDHQSVYAFEDFDSYTAGQLPVSPFIGASNSSLIRVDNDRVYAGSNALKLAWNSDAHQGAFISTGGTLEAYCSMRFNNVIYQDTSPDGQNIKIMHWGAAYGSHATNPNLYTTMGPDVVGFADGGGTDIERNGAFGYGAAQNTWHREERFFKLSNPAGAFNGKVYIKQNQQGGSYRVSWWGAGTHLASPSGAISHTTYDGDERVTRPAGNSNLIWSIYTSNYKRDNGDRCELWFDEVYVDIGQNAQARIELGETAFGTDSRPRNPCPYSAWGTNSITVTLNAGPNGIAGRGLYFVSGEGVVEKIGEFS